MNNLMSYCGLPAARISASEKDLPVLSELRFSKIDHCVASYGGVSGEGRKLPYAFAQQ